MYVYDKLGGTFIIAGPQTEKKRIPNAPFMVESSKHMMKNMYRPCEPPVQWVLGLFLMGKVASVWY
jgi:hypothetical protein